MARTAADVMQTHLITVGRSDPLESVKRLFYEEEIHGAPVVDDDGRVLGVITSMDLIRAAMDSSDHGGIDFGVAMEEVGLRWSDPEDSDSTPLDSVTVEDVMTGDAVSVDPNTPISQVARVLRENRIHRVLVVDKDSLVGIVSTFDLIQVLEQGDDADDSKKP